MDAPELIFLKGQVNAQFDRRGHTPLGLEMPDVWLGEWLSVQLEVSQPGASRLTRSLYEGELHQSHIVLATQVFTDLKAFSNRTRGMAWADVVLKDMNGQEIKRFNLISMVRPYPEAKVRTTKLFTKTLYRTGQLDEDVLSHLTQRTQSCQRVLIGVPGSLAERSGDALGMRGLLGGIEGQRYDCYVGLVYHDNSGLNLKTKAYQGGIDDAIGFKGSEQMASLAVSQVYKHVSMSGALAIDGFGPSKGASIWVHALLREDSSLTPSVLRQDSRFYVVGVPELLGASYLHESGYTLGHIYYIDLAQGGTLTAFTWTDDPVRLVDKGNLLDGLGLALKGTRHYYPNLLEARNVKRRYSQDDLDMFREAFIKGEAIDVGDGSMY